MARVLDQVENFVKVTVSTGYDDTAEVIVLSSGHGSLIPDPIDGEYNMTWFESSTYGDASDDPNKEIVRVIVKDADTITVVRANEGTLASTKNTFGKVYKLVLAPTKKVIDNIDAELQRLIYTSGENTGDQVISDATITTTDITTNNATSDKHGFLPKLSGVASQYLNGEGNYATPAGIISTYLSQSFTSQTTVTVTHSFGAYPVVQVIDNTGAVLIPLTITNTSVNAFTVTFDVSTTGIIVASVGSPQSSSIITVTDNYTIVGGDKIINETASGKTVTMITAVGRAGQEFIVKNSSVGDVIIDTTSSQTIDGSLTVTLATQESITVVSDGANYIVIY
jgi:hypothetical protein